MDTGTRGVGHRHTFTIGELAEAYLAHAEHELARSTFESYRKSVRVFLSSVGAGTPAQDVRDFAIARFMAERKRSVSHNTVRSDYRRLRHGLYRWAVERGLLERNWCALATPPPADRKTGRAITARDFGRMLIYADDEHSRTRFRDLALLLVLWDTGMRAGELRQIEVADLRLDARNDAGERDPLIHIRAEVTKTSAERYVPVSERTRAALLDYLAFERGREDGPLFLSSSTGRAFHEQTVKHVVRELGERAGVVVGAHDFRRAIVGRLQAAGMADTLIMRITGHQSLAMIELYGRPNGEANARAAYRRATR